MAAPDAAETKLEINFVSEYKTGYGQRLLDESGLIGYADCVKKETRRDYYERKKILFSSFTGS